MSLKSPIADMLRSEAHLTNTSQRLTVPGKSPSSRVITDPTSGYNSTPFAGKNAQFDEGMCHYFL